ncbi:raftlin-2 isoform X2 [Petromyzon marinus]|uniref:raftlin-2 isoform X2 n=1 Tax=Petromyzon marinus TaxID=7757 RepID=UPI003F710BA9
MRSLSQDPGFLGEGPAPPVPCRAASAVGATANEAVTRGGERRTPALDALPEGVQAVASVLDLPARLHDLGRRGFWVAAVHPLLLPWGRRRSLLDQMLRLVLVRPSPTGAGSGSEPPGRFRLLVEECPLSGPELTTEAFKTFLKKSLEAAVERGHAYVGAVAQYSPGGAGSLPRCSGRSVAGELPSARSLASDERATPPARRSNGASREAEHGAAAAGEGEADEEEDDEVFAETTPDARAAPGREDSPEEEAAAARELEGESTESGGHGGGYDLRVFLLYNVPEDQRPGPAYYTDTLPIRVTRRGHALSALDADWLDRLSRHLEEGATLADAQILPFTGRGDRGPKALEGLLVFEENVDTSSCSSSSSCSSPEMRTGNDVIVVEQLTLIEGYEVKTDYVPLLHTLAESGWLLTAILPTPVVKPDSEGNLVSKQIVFLQRPMQPARPTPDIPKSGKKA